ncbi:M15 family metallopeptidase [Pseudochrobactrum kiredjianiae]|uniref:D-alanyl-D-alanine carboxypeptidase family protein n=1 Tax=Pseudochrobactrum kiredjianiae TaxID=386305 RepID=A0ABW3V3B6_9HYPH|nr:D-alanyl-D-alanine carboxypeptidase family protein [Pseudochrobactrum kiredjianiae]MDM7852371.1 D-alanyl-D-alanine carboxypeptidase family protein [Pseudochrobactrum kiredjianiae]
MSFDFKKYAVGGAMRPDSFSGLDQGFASALSNMFAAAPPEIAQQLRITSGFRSPERQAQLWQNALQKYGSPERARKWVAPPGRSNHNHGHAADLKYLDPSATAWAHENAGRFGLAFPLSNENWHIELANRRGGKPDPAMVASAPPSQSALPLPSGAAPQAGQIAQEQANGEPVPSFAEAAATSEPSRSQSSLNALLQAFGQQPEQASPFSPVQFAGVSPNQSNALASLVASIKQGRA